MAHDPIGDELADVLLPGICRGGRGGWRRIGRPRPRRLGRPHDRALLVNPGAARNIDDAEFRVHFVRGVDQ
jgi:hypothetical protein